MRKDWIDSEINSLHQRLLDTQMHMSENNVPDLKNHIDKKFNDIDSRVDNLELQNLEIIKSVCGLTNGDC